MDDDGRELLAGFARARAPSAARQAQAWEAIEGRIALGDVGPPVSDGGASVGAWGKVALVVLVGGAVMLAVFGVSRTGGDPASSASPMLSRVVLPSAPPVSGQPPDPPDPPDPLAASRLGDPLPQEGEQAVPAPKPEPAARTPARSPNKPPAVATPAKPPSSSLAEEIKLLRRASSQLRTRAFSKALVTLAEHGRRFPDGALAAEREIRRAEVHCERGDAGAARRVVDAFLRAHPRSTLRTRALGICKPEREDAP